MKRTKTNIIISAVIVFLVSVDQVIKIIVDGYLKPIGEITVIPDILRFRYLENDGAMMGFMDGKTSLMTILAIICFGGVAVLIFSGKIQNRLDLANFVLVCAGGLGNIIDRIIRGYVIDYIDVLFVDFYVFNFADCLITVGAFLLFFNQIYQIYKEQKDKNIKVQND